MDAWNQVETPALVYDEQALSECAAHTQRVVNESGCTLLYTLKPCTFPWVVQLLGNWVAGFSASSLFELRLAKESILDGASIHVNAPAYPNRDLRELAESCDYISFNSLSQYDRFMAAKPQQPRCGLRLNPKCSFVADERYDPCRRNSKLGIPLKEIAQLLRCSSPAINGITGIHFHNNCDSVDFGELLATAECIAGEVGNDLRRLSWVNLGGGYLFDSTTPIALFAKAVATFKERGLTVFAEPGAAMVRRAGFLVATVLDIAESDGKTVAILDATVNHAPEVFEYQFEPDVLGHRDDAEFKVILAGCSCLAGDLFGEYAFDYQLKIGSRVVFANMGAYTTTKWHMFNGINLPSVYALSGNNEVTLKAQFHYRDFMLRNGVESDAFV